MDQTVQTWISARPSAILPDGNGRIAEAAGRRVSFVEVSEGVAFGVVGGASDKVDVSEGQDE